MNLSDLPDLIPEKIAAKFLHKSVTTMWRLRKEGLIAFRRMGGVFYMKEDILEFLARCKVNGRDKS